MKNKNLLDIVGDIDDKYIAQAAPTEKKPRKKSVWLRWGTIAACMVLFISASFGCFAFVAEAKEYKAAVQFFNENGMSAEGLTRGEIKEVYRDITTESFSFSKTAEVISKSIFSNSIGGYEIEQESPSPEDIKELWYYKNHIGSFVAPKKDGVHYEYRSEYKTDRNLGFCVHDKSYIEKYDGESLIWSTSVSEFSISYYSIMSDGVIVYGETPVWSSEQISNAWMAKIDLNGNLLWKHKLDNDFENEYIAAVLQNADGSYAVISRGDYKYLCLSQYTVDGKETSFKKNNVGNYGIVNAVRFEDGYIVQLGSYMTNEHAKIIKVDRAGNITESFNYSDNDSNYYITDMIEFDENIYLSAYAVPKLEDETQNAGGRYEIAGVLNYLFENNIWEISTEELTPMVRDNYTAMLLVCEPNAGKLQEYYSVKGSMGSKLSVSDTGNLLWDVNSITSTFFSPATSSFTIGGRCSVFRYTFNNEGILISQDKTGESVNYSR